MHPIKLFVPCGDYRIKRRRLPALYAHPMVFQIYNTHLNPLWPIRENAVSITLTGYQQSVFEFEVYVEELEARSLPRPSSRRPTESPNARKSWSYYASRSVNIVILSATSSRPAKTVASRHLPEITAMIELKLNDTQLVTFQLEEQINVLEQEIQSAEAW